MAKLPDSRDKSLPRVAGATLQLASLDAIYTGLGKLTTIAIQIVGITDNLNH